MELVRTHVNVRGNGKTSLKQIYQNHLEEKWGDNERKNGILRKISK